MPLSSEDRPFLRDLFHEIRDVQRETNALLEEIRDLLKSPPVTIERWPTASGSTLKPGDTFSSRNGGRDLPKTPLGTFWYFQHEHNRYMLRPADASDCTCDDRSPGLCPVPGHRK